MAGNYFMIKKSINILSILFIIVSFSLAAEKKDTSLSNSSASLQTQQNINKGLAKQTKVYPKPQSNWSKIKDLFM
jgi:hypothetical protein